MNVLYLTMNPNRQSTTVPTEGWIRFLTARGLSPVVVSREQGQFPDWVAEQGFPVYYDPMLFPDRRRPWQFIGSLWALRRIVRRHRIDLVHCNEHDVYPAGQYLAKALGLPVVVSVHFRMEAGFCAWAFGGWKMPTRMLFVSHKALEACRPSLHGLVPSDRFAVLHNGLDLERYQPDVALGRRFREAHEIPADTLLLGVACALRPRKQLEHLVEAVERLRGVSLMAVVAGFAAPGDEDYSTTLMASAQARLGARFRFLGELDDLRGFSNALDLFVNTSQEESFGISVLEALACGCPVVGYDSKAVDEVVLPDGGEIVAQDDVGALAEAIRRWTSDRPALSSRRPAARRQAERFDLRVLSSTLWDMYSHIHPPSHAVTSGDHP